MQSKIELFKDSQNKYKILSSRTKIGTVLTDRDPLYGDHCGITLFLDSYNTEIAKELFALIRTEVGAPLQVMLYSFQQEQIGFFLAGGFVLKRRCYEVEASEQDLHVDLLAQNEFSTVRKGGVEYVDCCRRVFEYYGRMHGAGSRLTGSYEDFCKDLPEEVLCCKENNEIKHLAFVRHDGENYSIAYLQSDDISTFPDFCERLLAHLIGKAIQVWFQADDCDELAMTLRSFVENSEGSYNTYVYGE